MTKKITRIILSTILFLVGVGTILFSVYFLLGTKDVMLISSLILGVLFGIALLISAWEVAKGKSIWKIASYLFTGMP